MQLATAQAARPALPTKATLSGLPDGVAGTRATLQRMAQLVRAAKVDPRIRELAIRITAGIRNKDYPREARAVQLWMQENIRYVGDVRDVETLQAPIKTLELGAGDCDDQAMLAAALLESIGHRCRFVAIGPSFYAFHHVFTECLIRDRGGVNWYAIETTEPWCFGQRPTGPVAANRMIQSI